MSEKLTCPDCGGVLGPTEPGETGCICFKSEPASPSTIDQQLSDTHPVATLSKYCFKCGADVAGKKRYKDSRGYLCAECNKAEIDAEKAGTALCTECGRRVKEGALIEFRGVRMCKLCITELRDADKKKIKVISGKNFEEHDRKKLMILIGVLIVLAIFMVLGYFKARG